MDRYKNPPIISKLVKYEKGKISIKQMKLKLGLFGVLPLRFTQKGVFVETPEGRMLLNDGDYLIKDLKGNFYSCSSETVEK